jgi:hypothetical protein
VGLHAVDSIFEQVPVTLAVNFVLIDTVLNEEVYFRTADFSDFVHRPDFKFLWNFFLLALIDLAWSQVFI